MCKSSHLQKPTKIPVSAWDIFKKLVSYLVRSAQSASRGACLSWLSGKLQLCSSITQTRSSILSHKLPGTGGSCVVWGVLLFFKIGSSTAGSLSWRSRLGMPWHSSLCQEEPGVLQSRMELPWDHSRGRAGAPGPAAGPRAEQFLFCHVAVPVQMDTPL